MKKFTDGEWEEYLKEHQRKFEGNPEHLRILLEEGVEGWNKWTLENHDTETDLQGADLSNTNLQKAYFGVANLQGANLFKTNLQQANLTCANLQDANLTSADFQDADLTEVNLQNAHLSRTNLRGAELSNANLLKATLPEANLQEVNLYMANLKGTYLRGVNLQGSDLTFVDFSTAILTDIKYKKEIKINNLVIWSQNSIKSCLGIDVDSCKGNAVFKRYAQDQDFLETFRESQPAWYNQSVYYLWKVSCNCGQSMALWIFWSLFLAIWFAAMFAGLGAEAFVIPNLDFYDFDTLIYYSVVTFTTLGFGDITPASSESARWVMAEVITGYIMLGGLISIFATKLARRS